MIVVSVLVRRLREGKRMRTSARPGCQTRTSAADGARHERIDDVIEPDTTRSFYVQVAEDEFS